MNAHLTIWLSDHRRYRSLLGLLESQIGEFLAGGSPDYELMLDIMHYMTECPDRLHHVHEDDAYSALAEKHPEFEPTTSRLQEQHREIVASGLELVRSLKAIVEGTMMARETVDSKASAYVTQLREHLLLEEYKLFPVLERNNDCLDHLPLARIDSDPLFGTAPSERYQPILTLLERQAG